jgi:hypothetical protein
MLYRLPREYHWPTTSHWQFFSYSIQHFVMFVSDLWQVYGCYLSILNNIMWSSLLVTYDRSDIFSRYSIKHYVKFVRSATCSRSVVFFSYSIQHFVKFVSDVWQVYGFYRSIQTTSCDEVCQWYSLDSLYNIMWWSLSLIYGRSVIFSRYSDKIHRPVTSHWQTSQNVV